MDSGNKGDTSALYVWNGICMFWGTSFHTDPHWHNTLQLVFDIDKTFGLKDQDSDWEEFEAAIIKEGHMHQLDSKRSIQLFIYLDPDSFYAKALSDKFLVTSPIASLKGPWLRKLSTGFFKKLLVQSDCQTLMMGCNEVFKELISLEPFDPVDDRVLKAIEYITKSEDKKFKVKDVAAHVCLSESRLRHLFKAQIGQPIQNFILWMKVVDSLNMVLRGEEIAQSAVNSGFWDGSHMTRSYRELIGITPSQVKSLESKLKIVACSKRNLGTLKTEVSSDWRKDQPKKTIEI